MQLSVARVLGLSLALLALQVSASERKRRQVRIPGAGVVGKGCSQGVECGSGGYCAGTKLCACLSTYVEIDAFCWLKINPGESGCTDSRQCEAVWPESYCRAGECKCANNQPAFETRDGPVCLNYGSCPLGEEAAKYQEPSGNPLRCAYGLDATCVEGYDCVCGAPAERCADKAVFNFCCPSRGLTCTMPRDEGSFPSSGGTPIERFYHNPMSGTCEPFAYRGRGGNANNFYSRNHCESYCKQTCLRGMPQYDKVQITVPKIKAQIHYCSSAGRDCDNNYQCETVGTQEYCCPKPSFICSKKGGLFYRVPPESNFDAGTAVRSGITFARFYYDEAEKRCLPFTYLGQGGNFNQFLSQTHCEQFCSRIVCEAGEPMRDNGGISNFQCGRTTPCPASHYCTNALCCPTKQTVCKQPQALGSCGNYAERWWFNAESGNCQEFRYSGCQGNANNFPTYKECSEYCRDVKMEPQCPQGRALTDSKGTFVDCGGTDLGQVNCPANHHCYFDGRVYGCCPTQVHTCSLSSHAGAVCGPRVTRWAYDGVKKACATFEYAGCDGNSNNFATQQDCKDYCRVDSCPEGGSALRTQTGRQTRSCSASAACPKSHYCSPVAQWSGFGYGLAQLCCPTKGFICALPRDPGIRCGSSTLRRWYHISSKGPTGPHPRSRFFNSGTRTCESFEFRGCEGNRNNFPAKATCQNYCLSSACRAGEIALREEGRLINCDASKGSGCPRNAACVQSAVLGQAVCCGVGPDHQDLCPIGSRPFVDALSLEARQCTPNVQGSCPGEHFCWFNRDVSAVGAYFCCQKDAAYQRSAARRPSNPQQANQGSTTAAPIDEDRNRPQVPDSTLCPPGLAAQLGEATPYRRCSPTAPGGNVTLGGCGPGVFCQHSGELGLFICCAHPTTPRRRPAVDDSGCPPEPAGLRAVVLNEAALECSPTEAASCPREAHCLYSQERDGFICCRLEGTGSTPQPLVPSGPTKACSEAPGFTLVVDPEGEARCDPLTHNSCARFTGQGKAAHCLYNVERTVYNCCLAETS